VWKRCSISTWTAHSRGQIRGDALPVLRENVLVLCVAPADLVALFLAAFLYVQPIPARQICRQRDRQTDRESRRAVLGFELRVSH
jgi:hypothetical protein